mmetsp:Transcript_146334/g.266843  ORF Transcript_146334/g.266843 Transcript_146334/m.266843 type:complete len:452 (+) Transcript_146334:59-1414(+)
MAYEGMHLRDDSRTMQRESGAEHGSLVRESDAGSDESNSDMPEVSNSTRRRIAKYAAVGGFTLLGVAMLGFIAVGFTSTRKIESQVGAQSSSVADSRPPVAVPRFLASDDLMTVVAQQSVKSNPACKENPLYQVCNASHLVPLLASHMTKHLQKIPKDIRDRLHDVHIGGDLQEAVKSAVPHLADPLVPKIANDLLPALKGVNDTTTEAAASRLSRTLKNRSSAMQELRAKLFPRTPPLTNLSAAEDMLHAALTSHGFHLQHSGNWNMNFEMSMPRRRGINLARELKESPDLFADLLPFEKAPKGGPPPPDNLAADIVAVLAIPLSHIVVCSLHRTGRLTLPYWTKIVITVEDLLTLGASDILPIIGLVIDMVFIWSPRGYSYESGTAHVFDPGFLDPKSDTQMIAFPSGDDVATVAKEAAKLGKQATDVAGTVAQGVFSPAGNSPFSPHY